MLAHERFGERRFINDRDRRLVVDHQAGRRLVVDHLQVGRRLVGDPRELWQKERC